MEYRPKPGTPVDELDTPILIVDLDTLDANIGRMAAFFAAQPSSLRPHSKTHKCPQIARRQLAAGAIGITCAKVSEAEVMVDAGIERVLVANEVVLPEKIEKLAHLARRAEVMVAVDSAANVAALSAACRTANAELGVLVEVDIGMGRCGVRPGEEAVALAEKVVAAPELRFDGLMGYEGHLVLVADPSERATKVREALAPLGDTCALLADAGIPAAIVSGGGTGTYDVTGTTTPMTEVQAGSYVFMDSTYGPVRSEFTPSLTLLTSVLSTTVRGGIVLDAGLKSISKEFGLPRVRGLAEALPMRYLAEEHAVMDIKDPDIVRLQPGDRVQFEPTHCCTTVNLHDSLYVVQNGRLVDIWPVAGRGCSR